MKKSHYLIAASLGAFMGMGAYTPYAAALTLTEALDAARNHWDVQQMRSNATAAQADVRAADRAPFPTFGLKVSSIPLQRNGDDAHSAGMALDWTIERGDKRALRTQSAQHAATAAEADREEGEIQQRLLTANAFFDLAAAQERVQHIRAIAESTTHIAAAAARRVKAGDLARQDALRLEIEAERAQSDVLSAQLEYERAQFALKSLMGGVQPVSGWHVDADTLKIAAPPQNENQENHPPPDRADVRAAAARVASFQAAVENASAQNKADVTVGMSVDHYPGTSTQLMEVRLQMPLQWGYAYQGEIGRVQAQLDSAEQALEKIRHNAVLDWQALQAQLRNTAQRQQRYATEIVPRAREVAAQAELAYSKGALSLNDLLDARRTLRNTGLEALAVQADYAKAYTAWRLRTEKMEKGTP